MDVVTPPDPEAVRPPQGGNIELREASDMPPAEASALHSSVAERYRVLLDIGRTLTGTLSHDDLYRAIHRETARVLEAAGFYIALYEPTRDLATIVFYADRGTDRHVEISYRGSDSDVIRTGRPSLVEDRAAIDSLLVLGEQSSEITRSAISAPLRHTGQVIGAISTQSYRPRAYTSDDLELLQGIADIAAVAIENARFVAVLERQRKEAEQIEEIGRALAASLDPQEVLSKVIDAVMSLVPVQGASVWLIEGDAARVAASGGGLGLSEGTTWRLQGPVRERLIRERAPLILEDIQGGGLVPPALRPLVRSGSGIAVPLVVAGEVAGALSAGSVDRHFFAEDETRILLRLASQASVALENARLHSSLQALSLTDPLTALPNRRQLEIHLEREVAAARRGRDIVITMFDLDNFKTYNDSHGHLAGDEALRAFGRLLAEENRAMNLVARYGGDEFVAVLSESSVEGARTYVRRVGERMAEDPLLGPGGVTMSAGMSPFDRSSMETPQDVLAAADHDLYRNKVKRAR